jgi:transposase
VLTSVQRKSRWTPAQKIKIVKKINKLRIFISMVGRQFGITAAQLFQWRKVFLQGSVIAVGVNELW